MNDKTYAFWKLVGCGCAERTPTCPTHLMIVGGRALPQPTGLNFDTNSAAVRWSGAAPDYIYFSSVVTLIAVKTLPVQNGDLW